MKRLHSFRRRGRWFHYYRWPDGRRVPLIHDVEPDDPRLADAWAACHAKAMLERRTDDAPPRGSSVEWGLLAYMHSPDFSAYAAVTRANRSAVYRRLIKAQGARPLSSITREDVEAALARKSAHGALADMKAIRPAFAWMARAGMIEADPTAGIRRRRLPKSDGYRPWTAADVTAFVDRWPRGTRQRLAFDLAIFTGQRREDLRRLGRQMVRDGVLEVRQSKTGALAYVPLTDELAEAVEPFRDRMVWLLTANGKPFSGAGLGNFFRDAATAAGVDKSLHGLRKAFCIYHAEAGRSAHQIMAMSGHKRLDEVEIYTRAADRRRIVQALGLATARPNVATTTENKR